MVSEWATRLQFSLLDRTKLVTATSELGRNLLVHAGGGSMEIAELLRERQPGLQLRFIDQGPGIASIEQAMTDGFSTAGSLGLGLSGARRLVHEFEITSAPGEGTTITITQWKRR